MDDIDRKIIDALRRDAKKPLAEIGSLVGLAASSVTERVRRLVATGVIRRFTLDLDPEKMGLPTLVFIWIALRDDADEPAFRAHIAAHPQVLECHHVTGAWAYLVKIRVDQPAGIEAFLAGLKAMRFLGRSESVIALSSPRPDSFIPPED